MLRSVSVAGLGLCFIGACIEENPNWSLGDQSDHGETSATGDDAADNQETTSSTENSNDGGSNDSNGDGDGDGQADDATETTGSTSSGGGSDDETGSTSTDGGDDSGETGTTGGGTSGTDGGDGTETTDSETTGCGLEICNGVDDDCDGLVDEASTQNSDCDGCALEADAGRVYWFCPETVTWAVARTACIDRGAQLAVVRDAIDNQFLADHHPSAGGSFAPNFWIGLSDSAAEGVFTWVDGSSLAYSAWAPGEPNNGNNEDCVEFYDIDPPVWNDRGCAALRPYVCEVSDP